MQDREVLTRRRAFIYLKSLKTAFEKVNVFT